MGDAEAVSLVDHQSPSIACPKCGSRRLPVLYTRHRPKRIVRIRRCHDCRQRVVTYEEVHGRVVVRRRR